MYTERATAVIVNTKGYSNSSIENLVSPIEGPRQSERIRPKRATPIIARVSERLYKWKPV